MCIGVALAILGEAALFRAPHLAEDAALMLLIAHTFVIFYEESTLRRQFGGIIRKIPSLCAPVDSSDFPSKFS
jgi:hypothetical protein